MKVNYNNPVTAEKIIRVHVSSNELSKFDIIGQSIQKKKLHLALKRSFDVIASILLIALFFPIFILVSLLIMISSKGSVLYSKDRIGFNGRYFKCYKFRSMIIDHTKKREEYTRAVEYAKNGILNKNKSDVRVTFIGKVIRKTSIDELPQLFNVLIGDMSMVGPRPLVPFMLNNYPEFKEIRSLVRPGITGLWQVRARESNTSAEFMMQHDIEYIQNFNFFFDLKIVAETPLVVLSGKGAY